MVVSILYIGSAVSGIEKGIKVISDTNLYVAIGLLLVWFLVGPKIEILDSFVNGIGQYIGDFIPDALKVGAYGDNSWLGSWRLFYWAWFIAWAPFVAFLLPESQREEQSESLSLESSLYRHLLLSFGERYLEVLESIWERRGFLVWMY